MTFRLFALQRLTALVMTPMIAAHLGMILYATIGGLSAAEILGRTRGSLGWGAYYGAFVVLASIHGAIGIRVVLGEWTRIEGRVLDAGMWLFAAVLIALGLRAVAAVVMP